MTNLVSQLTHSHQEADFSANFLLDSVVERLHHKLDFAERDIGTSFAIRVPLAF